jgi:hypothetical protein
MKKILHIDDEQHFANMVRKEFDTAKSSKLIPADIELHWVTTVQDAIEWIKENRDDLIYFIFDIRLENENTYQLYHWYGDEVLRSTGAVFFSSMPERSVYNIIKSFGAPKDMDEPMLNKNNPEDVFKAIAASPEFWSKYRAR